MITMVPHASCSQGSRNKNLLKHVFQGKCIMLGLKVENGWEMHLLSRSSVLSIFNISRSKREK